MSSGANPNAAAIGTPEGAMLSLMSLKTLLLRLDVIFPRNLKCDPQHVLDGMLVLHCFFCKTFGTPIDYDMRVHLLDNHRKELFTQLPIRGKGLDTDYRISFITDIMKRNKPQVYYNHKNARFES